MTSVGFQSIDTIEVLSKARVVSQEGAPLHLISFDFLFPLITINPLHFSLISRTNITTKSDTASIQYILEINDIPFSIIDFS